MLCEHAVPDRMSRLNTDCNRMTIAAAIVTHNRLELLKLSINSLRAQTRKPDEIIIINNASTDGTTEWLAGQEGLFVVS